jgi:hypothetical protein
MLKRAPYTSLVLIRCKPFYDWLAYADGKEGNVEDHIFPDDQSTYLTQEYLNTPNEIQLFLDKHFVELFENELNQWHPRELWPDVLTRKMFDEWFEIKINREVFFAG